MVRVDRSLDTPARNSPFGWNPMPVVALLPVEVFCVSVPTAKDGPRNARTMKLSPALVVAKSSVNPSESNESTLASTLVVPASTDV